MSSVQYEKPPKYKIHVSANAVKLMKVFFYQNTSLPSSLPYAFKPATHQGDITSGGSWNLFASYQTFTRHHTRLDFEIFFSSDKIRINCRLLAAGMLRWADPERRGWGRAGWALGLIVPISQMSDWPIIIGTGSSKIARLRLQQSIG